MVVIIGGGKRIGKGLVSAYSKSSPVVYTYHQSQSHSRSGRVRAVRLDARNIGEIRKFAEGFRPKSISTLLYVSSTFYPVKFGRTKESEWCDLVDVNMKGAYFLCEALRSKMKPKSNIQFFNDVLIEKLPTERLPYAMAKAGLTILMKTLARAWAPEIRVNEIRLGYALPPPGTSAAQKKKWLSEIPMGKFTDLDAIIRTSFFLASEPLLTGFQANLDGGLSLKLSSE